MTLLIMQFSPTSRQFVPPRSKYSPQHPVLKRPQLAVSLILMIATWQYNCKNFILFLPNINSLLLAVISSIIHSLSSPSFPSSSNY
jgi:hypothetical protein